MFITFDTHEGLREIRNTYHEILDIHFYSEMSRKTPKKITRKYLENAGTYYLNRYSSSVGNFRNVMTRKIDKSIKAHPDQDKKRCLKDLEAVITKFLNLGYLDDAGYARRMTLSLRRQGKSSRAIVSKLHQKGIETEQIETALEELEADDVFSKMDDDKNIDYLCALKHCQKKRLGPFSKKITPDAKNTDNENSFKSIDKDLAKLARAGFSYSISKDALNTPQKKALKLLNSSLDRI